MGAINHDVLQKASKKEDAQALATYYDSNSTGNVGPCVYTSVDVKILRELVILRNNNNLCTFR